MSTALFVVYLLTTLLLLLLAWFARTQYRDLSRRIDDSVQMRHAGDALSRLETAVQKAIQLAGDVAALKAEQADTRRDIDHLLQVCGRVAEVAALKAEQADTRRDIDHLLQVYERVAAEQAELATGLRRAESRHRGLAITLEDSRRQAGHLAATVSAIERTLSPRLEQAVARLATNVWETGIAQSLGQIPGRPFLPGFLRLPADGDAPRLLDLTTKAAEAVGLEVVLSVDNTQDGGMHVLGFRTSVTGGVDALAQVAATTNEELVRVNSGHEPAGGGALKALLTAVAAVPGTAVLVGYLLCDTDHNHARCRVFTTAELADLVGWLAVPDPDLATATAGRDAGLGPWLDEILAENVSRRQREEAIRLLAEELRPEVTRDLRRRLEEEEAPRIEQEIRDELTPVVRRELERQLRET